MRRRLLVAFTVFVLVELGVFYWRHHDLVRLSLGREFVIADPKFTSAATSVLSEEEVSRRVLERIADVAGVRGERDLQIRALERIVQAFPDDAGTRLRLAQALREAGRFEEAERIYRGALGLPEKRG
jgi:tetratricopeptide (TPR) repeat protein